MDTEIKNVPTAATTISKAGKKILDLEINRDPEKGLVIKITSPISWKALRHKNNRSITIGGVKCFYPAVDRIDGAAARFVADNVYEYDSQPNMALLLAENLSNGVTFNFGLFPISEDKIKDWVNKFKQEAKLVYLTCIKAYSVRLVITSKTIETENHDI